MLAIDLVMRVDRCVADVGVVPGDDVATTGATNSDFYTQRLTMTGGTVSAPVVSTW